MNPSTVRSPESLAPRLALAGVFSFFDVDGDVVTIRSDRGTDRDLAAAVSLNPVGLGVQLTRVDLSRPVFAGARLRITSEDSGGGDRQAHVGEIVADVDLRVVEVNGDVGRVDIGDADVTTRGLGRLTVRSMGVFGRSTGASRTDSVVRGAVGTVAVGGDMRGAFLTASGRVRAFKVGGDIDGAGDGTGIQAQSIDELSVGGALIGGPAFGTGSIRTFGGIGTVRIAGDVTGGTGESSGSIQSLGRLGQVTIGGSLSGSIGASSGRISAGVGGIGRLTVGGGVFGGGQDDAGVVQSNGGIGTVRITGSLLGGSGQRSGRIAAARGIGSVQIGSDIVGGPGVLSGSVAAGGRIGQLDVGSIFADSGASSGSVTAGRLETVNVRGGIVGSATQPALVSAVGGTGQAIAALTVGGSVSRALVLAGYDVAVPTTGEARIGTVTVGGNLSATSIAAGVLGIMPGQFGRIGDTVIGGSTRSRIDSVTVAGTAVGSANPGDSFGVSAASIGRVRIGGARYAFATGLVSSPAGDNFGIHDL